MVLESMWDFFRSFMDKLGIIGMIILGAIVIYILYRIISALIKLAHTRARDGRIKSSFHNTEEILDKLEIIEVKINGILKRVKNIEKKKSK